MFEENYRSGDYLFETILSFDFGDLLSTELIVSKTSLFGVFKALYLKLTIELSDESKSK